jgi:hypothetical protein
MHPGGTVEHTLPMASWEMVDLPREADVALEGISSMHISEIGELRLGLTERAAKIG